jgi:hypothetical protein
MNKIQLAAKRKAQIIEVCRASGEDGVDSEEITAAIGYTTRTKGGGGVGNIIDRINLELLYAREPYRIRRIIRTGSSGKLRSHYRIEAAGKRAGHYEQPRA